MQFFLTFLVHKININKAGGGGRENTKAAEKQSGKPLTIVAAKLLFAFPPYYANFLVSAALGF